MYYKHLTMFSAAAVLAVVCGCGQAPPKMASNTPAADHDHVHDGHTHDGWWCDEHGVPEEVCAQCDPKLVAGFKEKGDWCEKHDRPDSQCFVCHPEKEAEFAAQYEAKYGKKPPKPQAEKEAPAAESKS